jgi:hypothetical protein
MTTSESSISIIKIKDEQLVKTGSTFRIISLLGRAPNIRFSAAEDGEIGTRRLKMTRAISCHIKFRRFSAL